MIKFTILMLIVSCLTINLSAQTNYLRVDNSVVNSTVTKKTFKEGVIKEQHNVRLKSTNIFFEDFSSGSLPTGWENIDNLGTGAWFFDNPGSRNIYTTTSANGFVIFDSDYLGSGITENADLITPAIDCSSLTTVMFSFEHYYYGYNNGGAEVFISGDNGVTWTSLGEWSTASTNNAEVARYNITDVAAGKSQVKIKWNYQGNYAWYWAIDDVLIYDEASVHDLAVQEISGDSEIFVDEVVSPVVTIKNAGEFEEGSYSVFLTDGASYSETVNVTTSIIIGDTYDINFPDWTPTLDGSYNLTATVTCEDDFITYNNVLIKEVTVTEPESDLSVYSINVDSEIFVDEVVSPVVTIKNMGDIEESSYSVILTDGVNYSETINVTGSIVVGDTYDITFPDWTPVLEGSYTLTATVTCTDDFISGNDVSTIEVTASGSESDLSIYSINVDSELLSSTTITPTVSISNLGNIDESSYSVLLSDGNGYSETIEGIITITAGALTTITFPDWAPVASDYTLTATVSVDSDINGHNNSLSLNVVVSDPEHDLAVFAVPNAIASGTIVTPYVTIINNGDYTESSYSVMLSDGSDYTESVDVTTAIDPGATLQVALPEWTPADGTYSLTANVNVTDDANTDNNTITQACKTVTERMAYTSNYNSGNNEIGNLNIPFDNFILIGTNSSIQIRSLTWNNDVLYGITLDGILGSINTGDASFTEIGSTDISASYFTSLICDPTTGTIFVTTLNGSYPDFNVSLYSIDQESGLGTLVATSTNIGCFSQFAFDGDGQLYAVQHIPDEHGFLYSVDKTTAEMTLVGDLGLEVSSNFQPMSWDVYNEVMYFQASTGSSGNMQGSYVINLNTGAATLVGTPYTNQVLAMVLPVWDANLQNLTVDGTAIEDFSPSIYDYEVSLPSGTTTIPAVGATAFYSSADVVITDASELPGSATVVVTPPEGAANTYTISFNVLDDNDATLSDLMVDGATVDGFVSSTLTYNVELPYGTTTVPTVTATKTDVNANDVITDATSLPGSSIVLVTAADGITQQSYTVNFTVASSVDATLSDLMVNGETVDGFVSSTLTYDVLLSSGTSVVPTITVVPTINDATYVINEASALPGSTTVQVTAADGITEQSYTVNFAVASITDASLSDLIVKGETVLGFDASTLTYEVLLPSGTSAIPMVTALVTDTDATYVVNNATSLPGSTIVEVTAADGSTQQIYTLNFTVAQFDDATLSDLKVEGQSVDGFSSSIYAYDVVLPYGTTVVPDVSATTNDSRSLITEITDAPSIPGTTTVYIEANDGSTTSSYTVNFVIASIDATLFDLAVDGSTVDEFSSLTYTYDVLLSEGTTVVPTVTALVNDINAITEITTATSLPGSTIVLVTAQNGNTLSYTVNFTVFSTEIDDSKEQQISIYPNPAVDIIHLKTSAVITCVSVLSTNGQLVSQTQINNKEGDINVTGLSKGVYLLRIETKDNVVTRKVQVKK